MESFAKTANGQKLLVTILPLSIVAELPIFDVCRRSGVFIVNFEQISHFVLVFPLLTLN